MKLWPSKQRTGPGFWLVPRLALQDLRHDWVLSACLVFALSAVIAPLLLLFGLKFGYVQTLRHRLIQNPFNREIRPIASVEREREWFHALAQRPEVAFVVPSIRSIAAPVQLSRNGSPAMDTVDLLPSAPGDPLLTEDAQPIPVGHQLVLTAMAARSIDAKRGDRITMTALRSDGEDRATVEMEVIGVLGMTSSGIKSAYAPLDVLEAVEAFKDGRATPEFHWPGTTPTANPIYDGAILVVPEALPEDKQLRLTINTGFVHLKEVPPAKMEEVAGWKLAPGHVAYLLSTDLSPVRRDSLAAVRDQLRGSRAEVLPWVRPIAVTLSENGGAPVSALVQALSVEAAKAAALGISPVPPWGATEQPDLQILLPGGGAQREVRLASESAGAPLRLPLQVVGSVAAGRAALVPAALAGVLRLQQTRRLIFDAERGQILLQPLGYAGFRMYARTIDDVEPLRKMLVDEGVSVGTEAREVARVTELDRNLTRVFMVIACTGIAGGVAALVASLYASVERKRRELGTLRLIGLSRGDLVRFPLFQGLTLVFTGFTCAALFFFAVSQTVDGLFREFRQPGESFCRIPPVYLCESLAVSLALALFASIVAAWRVSTASAADALRDE